MAVHVEGELRFAPFFLAAGMSGALQSSATDFLAFPNAHHAMERPLA